MCGFVVTGVGRRAAVALTTLAHSPMVSVCSWWIIQGGLRRAGFPWGQDHVLTSHLARELWSLPAVLPQFCYMTDGSTFYLHYLPSPLCFVIQLLRSSLQSQPYFLLNASTGKVKMLNQWLLAACFFRLTVPPGNWMWYFMLQYKLIIQKCCFLKFLISWCDGE